MATNKRYTLHLRRRREGRTNYKKRLQLLRGREHRLVIRKSNMHTHVQIVDYQPDGDVIIASASTTQLSKLGWKGATGNIPAAYLAGFMAGAAAKKAGATSAVVDLGMQNAYAGGRLFAAVQGAIDAGIEIPHGDEVMPQEDRITGAHIDEKLASSIEAVKKKVGGQ